MYIDWNTPVVIFFTGYILGAITIIISMNLNLWMIARRNRIDEEIRNGTFRK